LSPLLLAIVLEARSRGRKRRLFAFGFAAGVLYFGGTLYWLAQVMAKYGGISTLVAGLLAFGLVAWLSVFVGVFGLLTGASVRVFGVNGLWFVPAFWVTTEWFRALLGGHFPWALLGSSQASVLPVVQFASVTGTYGLSALIAAVCVLPPLLVLSPGRSPRRRILIVALLLGLIPVWGVWRMQAGDLTASGSPLRVGLLQGNVPQEQKWDAAYRAAILERYVNLSREAIAAGAQLVVWPESSTPFYFDLDARMAEPVRRLAAQSHTPFLIGTDEFERAGTAAPVDRYFNAAAVVGPDGRSIASYRKIRLVPFGEFVPFKRLLFFVGRLVENVSDFSPGEETTVFDVEGTKFSVAICYEVIYSDMAREVVDRGSQLLTTITNDAWFGRSSAAYQHFEQAGLRAVEQGRYLVRAANTGISGGYDPYGRILRASRLFETTMMTVDVRLLSGRTIYSRAGDVVLYLAFAITAGGVLAARRRSRARMPMPPAEIMTP
jgi:apolipoprotein N-acyltransferase